MTDQVALGLIGLGIAAINISGQIVIATRQGKKLDDVKVAAKDNASVAVAASEAAKSATAEIHALTNSHLALVTKERDVAVARADRYLAIIEAAGINLVGASKPKKRGG